MLGTTVGLELNGEILISLLEKSVFFPSLPLLLPHSRQHSFPKRSCIVKVLKSMCFVHITIILLNKILFLKSFVNLILPPKKFLFYCGQGEGDKEASSLFGVPRLDQ